MKRIVAYLLVLLSAIGWGCGFAIIGLAAFPGAPTLGPPALIFAAFGFGAGAVLATSRLLLEYRRRQPAAGDRPSWQVRTEGAPFSGSVYGVWSRPPPPPLSVRD